LHQLLLAGLPAHYLLNPPVGERVG
jgi:hypothetical protein